MENLETIDVESLKKNEKVFRFNKKDKDKHPLIGYSKYLIKNSYSVRTSKEYSSHVKRLLGKDFIISIQIIKDYFNKDNIKKTTISYAAIRLFLKYLADEKDFNFPHFNFPRNSRNINLQPPAPKKEDIEKVILTMKKEFDKSFKVYDYSFLLEFMWGTGCRVSEVIKMKVRHISWKRWLNSGRDFGEVIFKDTKGKRDRIVPISKALMEKLYKFILEEDKLYKGDFFFFDFGYDKFREKKFRNWKKEKKSMIKGDERSEMYLLMLYVKKCEGSIQRELKNVSGKVLEESIKTHSIRAGKATYLVGKGLELSKVRDYLGHKNISTTSLYLRNDPELLKEEFKKIGEL